MHCSESVVPPTHTRPLQYYYLPVSDDPMTLKICTPTCRSFDYSCSTQIEVLLIWSKWKSKHLNRLENCLHSFFFGQ